MQLIFCRIILIGHSESLIHDAATPINDEKSEKSTLVSELAENFQNSKTNLSKDNEDLVIGQTDNTEKLGSIIENISSSPLENIPGMIVDDQIPKDLKEQW